MNLKVILTLCLMALAAHAQAQMKIGGAPGSASANAYLQLGDSVGANKGMLMPRVALLSTNISLPLSAHVEGMAVYNTATAGTAPYDVTPGFYYDDGAMWVRLGSASGGVFLQYADSLIKYVTPAQLSAALAGKLSISDTAAMLAPYLAGADNGLSVSARTIGLGGSLKRPTLISASIINTIAISGLQPGAATDSLLVSESGTGILRRLAPASLLRVAKTQITAAAGQTQFTVSQPIADIDKLSVYRNGIRIEVTQVNTMTVQAEPGVVCDANDEIRIIQYY